MKISLQKIKGSLVPYSDEDMGRLNKLSDAVYQIDIKNMDMRTIKQNRALHLWCTQIANILNSNNLYMTGVFGNDIEWTMELVKTQIVKSLIKKLFDIDSTTKLKRKEFDLLINTIMIIFGEKKRITIPDFPNRELWNESNKKEICGKNL